MRLIDEGNSGPISEAAKRLLLCELMNAVAASNVDQDRRISEAFAREATRLGQFIRARVSDVGVAEDILQDVFSEFVEAERLLQPIEQAGAWLFRVARNRITDWFRRKKPVTHAPIEAEGEDLFWEDTLPSPDAGPDALYLRERMLEELVEALEELPDAQRNAFIAHEIEGLSFREIAQLSGESVNTLLSRKYAAVQHLRKRLLAVYDDADFIKGEKL
jgi:RNA polymerase sigma factor (sigma-70 family)